jgi:galactose mutarotase-like enzyme
LKVQISSGQIDFTAETMGAEPWILRHSGEEANYLWRPHADTERSGGTPLCFPLLGAVPNGKYTLNGTEYEMEMHGFAQYCDFAVVEKSENAMLLEIRDTPESFSRFPYAFRFQVLYRLEGCTLKTEYRVTNDSAEEMFFSVGGHPRFSCPIVNDAEGLRFSDYFLEFEKPHPPESVAKSYGPLETIRRFTSTDHRTLRLDYALFEKGAFCYSQTGGRTVTLKCAKDSRSLTMKSEGDAFLTIWNAPGETFIALEPWYGSITSLPVNPIIDGDWKARQGTICLGPGSTYTAVFYIIIQSTKERI